MHARSGSRVAKYLMPSIVIGLLYMVILAINGLWPFGVTTIDYYDMAQWSDPFYYHNYDQLLGQKSFIFDWYTNLGRVIPGLNEPSLFDLLFYLVPRDSILECMSFLMLVKIMAAAFFMGLFLKYVNKDLPYYIWLLLSSGYGLCGFVLINYTIPQWIDMAAVVPLILMFSQKALKEGKFIGLSVTVFLIMILDYYFTIQTLMLIFLAGGLYNLILIWEKKKGNEDKLFFSRLVAGIAIGLGLSAFSWLPDITFGLSSARFGSGVDEGGIVSTYLNLLKSVQPAYLSRWFCLLGMALPAALVAKGLFYRIRNKEYHHVLFCLVCIMMVVSQLFVESIHLILHFGSYVDYPMRNGFMIYCMMAGFAAGLYDNKTTEDNTVNRRGIEFAAVSLILAVSAAYVFRRIYVTYAGMSDHTVFLLTMGIMALFALLHLILGIRKTAGLKMFGVFLWAVEILIFGIIMIGKPLYYSGYANDPEQEGEYIRITDQLVRNFGDDLATGEAAATLRIKNPDTSLNANYGVVMRRETLCGWTNLASDDQINGAVSLGYSRQFTRILDSGGNIFSDTILHITDVISHRKLDDKLYEKVAATNAVIDHVTGETSDYYLYKNRYKMPFAIPIGNSRDLQCDSVDTVDIVNSYSAAMGSDDMIATVIKDKPVISSNGNHEISEYNIKVDGHKTLYFAGNCIDTDYYNTKISVNGHTAEIPSIKENSNELFPAHFNNHTVELGSFDNETVSVVIDMDISDPEQVYDNYIYEIDRDLLEELCNKTDINETVVRGRHSLDIDVEDRDGIEGVLIPVSYDAGWNAKVDGRSTTVQNINGLFMYVPLGGGSKIHMSYFPPLMKTGIVIAVASLICFAFLIKVSREKELKYSAIDTILSGIYAPAFLALFVIIYVIPVLFAIGQMI